MQPPSKLFIVKIRETISAFRGVLSFSITIFIFSAGGKYPEGIGKQTKSFYMKKNLGCFEAAYKG